MVRFLLLVVFFTNLLFASQKSVTVELLWKYQFEFAGYYMAKEKGFYEDVGLSVKLKEYNFGEDIVDDVLKEKADFGIGYPTIVKDRADGKKIVLLHTTFQTSPHVLATRDDIKSIRDFKNKKIMIDTDALQSASFLAMFRVNGVDIKDMITMRESFDVNDLIDKKCDIMSVYLSNEVYALKKAGVKYRIWDPKDYGFDFYGNILFTSQKLIDSDPKLVQNFNDATIKGWKYAFSHIDETVDLILKKYNTQHKSKDALLYEAKVLKKLAYFHTKEFGSLNKNRFQRTLDIYNLLGLRAKKIDWDKFIYSYERKTDILNEKEKAWVRDNTITVGVEQWEPIIFINQHHDMDGITADILQLIQKKLGLKYKIISSKWDYLLDNFQKGNIDLLPATYYTKERATYGLYTKKYFEIKEYIYVKKDNDKIKSFEDLKGKKIAIIKDYGTIPKIREKYPSIEIVQTANMAQSVKYVLEGRVEALVDAQIGVENFITKNLVVGLKGISQSSFKASPIYFFSNIKKPILRSILQKGLDSISKQEYKNITNKWLNLENRQPVDHTLLFKILGVVLVVMLLMFYRQYELKRYSRRLEQDIKKALNEAREKDKQLLQQSRHAQMGEMISMIAHQWRQPLAAISATSTSIVLKAKLKKLDDELAIELARKISGFSQHLSSTIDDFREFFKANKEKKEISTTEVIKNVLNIVKTSIVNKNIELTKDFQTDEKINTYPNELKQVILNLIKNAEDILLEKEIKNPHIKIKTYKKEDNIIIEVSDNAGGVPKNIIDKIFDPYFSTKTKKDGTGLGLHMSKTIIEEHCGGKLSVENDKNGAVFKIELKNKKDKNYENN